MEERTTVNTIQDSILAKVNLFILCRDVLKNLWVILLAGITAALVVFAIPYFAYKPLYTSTATLMVTGSAETGSSFSTYSSNAEKLCGILKDEYVMKEVEEELGMGPLKAQVDAQVMMNTNIISLSVSSEKATTSFRVLNGLLEHYTDVSEMMYPGYYLYPLIPTAYPSGPSNSLDVSRVSKMAALITMLVVTCLIILVSVMYDSVKSESDVEDKLDAKLYGAIYHEKKNKTLKMAIRAKFEKKNKNAVLISSNTASFGFVENYRRMRERFISRTKKSGKNVLMITSMLENEGKSTVAANMALGLKAVDKNKVILLDADLRKPAQYKVFDATKEGEKKASLSDYLGGKARIEDCIYYDEKAGLYILGNVESDKYSSEIISSEKMQLLVETLRKNFDYVIIDTPPMELVADAEMMGKYAQYSLLVIGPDNAPAAAVNDCIDRLGYCNAKFLGCVLNNVETISLFIEQLTGLNLAGLTNSGYGMKKSYSGYGYGYGYGYGQDAYGNSSKKKVSKDNTREVNKASDFFSKKIEAKPVEDKKEEEE